MSKVKGSYIFVPDRLLSLLDLEATRLTHGDRSIHTYSRSEVLTAILENHMMCMKLYLGPLLDPMILLEENEQDETLDNFLERSASTRSFVEGTPGIYQIRKAEPEEPHPPRRTSKTEGE